MEVKIRITYNAAKLASALPKIISKTASRYARLSAKGAKKNIDKGVSPALKASTISIRKNRGITGTKPLYETGNLHRSIKADKGSLRMKSYGFQHHKGFTTRASSMIPKKKVPARPFIKPDEQEVLTALNALKKDISQNFRK
tara:strand:- start:966 stop:1391 length:426 start_codon:yes stop_codon:yes gene_type:complete